MQSIWRSVRINDERPTANDERLFFFSSRRRHTRWPRDWSSDVCSSDLGLLVSSEINRGLDIFQLTPSAFLTQNEIDAASTVKLEFLNAQEQPRFVWPPSFAMARAFVDQLERTSGLPAARLTAVRDALASAEKATGPAKSEALTKL